MPNLKYLRVEWSVHGDEQLHDIGWVMKFESREIKSLAINNKKRIKRIQLYQQIEKKYP